MKKTIRLTESELHNVIRESVKRILSEDYDSGEHPYYDMLEEYDAYEVFNMFENKENPWLPLINPNMYKKALDEFVKLGSLEKFPTKYIYQWMGIIMKNTAILKVCTDIRGHSQWFPIDAFVDYYFEGDYDKWEEYKNENGEDNNFYAAYDFLVKRGYEEWDLLPDGSDAVSDYGIAPVEKLIFEYDRNMPAEQVLVLINKILDVTHQRGDLASTFIQGGSSMLTSISN